jgi:hypothetical protein
MIPKKSVEQSIIPVVIISIDPVQDKQTNDTPTLIVERQMLDNRLTISNIRGYKGDMVYDRVSTGFQRIHHVDPFPEASLALLRDHFLQELEDIRLQRQKAQATEQLVVDPSPPPTLTTRVLPPRKIKMPSRFLC